MIHPEYLVSRIVAKTNEYLDFPSVVGHETPFLDHLARDFETIGHEVRREPNLCIVDLGRPGPVYCAHVDRHGAVIDSDGRARFAAFAVKSEKYDDQATPTEAFAELLNDRHSGEMMFAYDRRSGGRIAYGRVSRVTLADGRLIYDMDDLPPLPPGTPVAFARNTAEAHGQTVSGQLDNPLSSAILRVLAECGLGGTCIFAAEEEIGRSAGHILSWMAREQGERSDLVVVDTTPFDDDEAMMAGTVVLRHKDARGNFDPDMTARLEAILTAHGTPILYKDSYIEAANELRRAKGEPEKTLGMTELGRIVSLSAGAVTGSTVQIPTTGYHTNRETTSRHAIINCAQTLLAL